MDETKFNLYLIVVSAIAVIVYIILHKVEAGYGIFVSKKWGKTISNRTGWVIMEAPVFTIMFVLWALSDRRFEIVPLCMFILFQTHYFQRSFIFPSLLRSTSRMPILIIIMGVSFNILNALTQGGWIFYISPVNSYPIEWLYSPQFICGTILFIAGMTINIHSDKIIRNLRKSPNDKAHYIPYGGMFKYVSSANYFGEFIQWVGFAILTWSFAGGVFALWTFANLAPRAHAIRKHYNEEFGEQFKKLKRKRIIPFIY